jgi:hypothetical protein
MHSLPPYGFIPSKFGPEKEEMPARFRDARGGQALPSDWDTWLDAAAIALGDAIWPRYVAGTGWQGGAKAFMDSLTMADLALIDSLRDRLDQPIHGSSATHRQLFEIEDKQPPSLEGLLFYLPKFETSLHANFKRLVIEGAIELGGQPTFALKRRMQRPRPYQCSLLLRSGAPFRHEVASSAVTPALVSGHCLQASLALVNVVIGLEAATGATLPLTTLQALQRYLIDAGDRRVYAGVHFPSDNLSSWACGLSLCAHYFDPTEAARARHVLWDAVTQHSEVYLAVKKQADIDKGNPLAQPLAWLQRLALTSSSEWPADSRRKVISDPVHKATAKRKRK